MASIDPLRDDARGFDDFIAVVTDCFHQIGMAHRVPHSFPNETSGWESCVEDAMAVPAASGKPLS